MPAHSSLWTTVLLLPVVLASGNDLLEEAGPVLSAVTLPRASTFSPVCHRCAPLHATTIHPILAPVIPFPLDQPLPTTTTTSSTEEEINPFLLPPGPPVTSLGPITSSTSPYSASSAATSLAKKRDQIFPPPASISSAFPPPAAILSADLPITDLPAATATATATVPVAPGLQLIDKRDIASEALLAFEFSGRTGFVTRTRGRFVEWKGVPEPVATAVME